MKKELREIPVGEIVPPDTAKHKTKNIVVLCLWCARWHVLFPIISEWWGPVFTFFISSGGMASGVMLMCLMQTGKLADKEFETMKEE